MASGAGGSSSSSSSRNFTVAQQALISRIKEARATVHCMLTGSRTRLEEILYPSWPPQSNPKEDQDLNALFQEYNTAVASVMDSLISLESEDITEESIQMIETSLDILEQESHVIRGNFGSLIDTLKGLDPECARNFIRVMVDSDK